MVFVELPAFLRSAASLFSDDDLAALQRTLLENPLAGDLLKETGGLRKLRVPLPGQGKRSGARVIYYYWVSERHCYLLYAYAKSKAENLSKKQLWALADLMKEVLGNE